MFLPCVLCFLSFSFFLTIRVLSADRPSLVRFAVIGDSGTGNKHQYEIARQMRAWHDRLPYGLTLMLGDNIYGGLFGTGGGEKKDFQRKFDRPYAELLARGVVFRAALGNHDLEHRDGLDLVEAYDRFHIESARGYYRFTAGQLASGTPVVEFLVLNTVRLEKNKQDPEQLTWLSRALAASQAHWRIVVGHHPLYSTGRRHGSDLGLRAKLEPILVRSAEDIASPAGGSVSLGQKSVTARVHVVLAGHDHIYQRFHPQKRIVHFVCGSSGEVRQGNAAPSPQVAVFEDRQCVFMLWEATPDALRFFAINEQGVAFDCGVISPEGTARSVGCSALVAVR